MKVTVVDNWNWAGFAVYFRRFLRNQEIQIGKPNTWNKTLTNTATIGNLEDEDFIDGVAENLMQIYYQILDFRNIVSVSLIV
jgi:hypothetical protein